MTGLIARPGAWLLQQAAALPDTLVMKTVAAERGWFETMTGIASTITAITLLVLVVGAAPVAWSFLKTLNQTRALLDRVQADFGPLSTNARRLADRLGEFNALLQVAQDEAEHAFVSTAAAVRGVRTGAASLGGMHDADDLGEDDNGDDDDDDERGARASARPRLRPRRSVE